MISRLILSVEIILILFNFRLGLLLAEEKEPGFPGKFFIVDRTALYDENNNELSNGSFESETNGNPNDWEVMVTGGTPTVTVAPRAEL